MKLLRPFLLVAAFITTFTPPAAAQCTPGGDECGPGLICINCGSGSVCAVPPASCCSDGGVCGQGMICLTCAGGTTCAIPPAVCCGDGACGDGLECVRTPEGPMCSTAGAPATGGTGGGGTGPAGPGGPAGGPGGGPPSGPGPAAPPDIPLSAGLSGGGIEEAIRATWPGQDAAVTRFGVGEMGAEFETHLANLKLPDQWQGIEIEVVTDAARRADLRSSLDYFVGDGSVVARDAADGTRIYLYSVQSVIQIDDLHGRPDDRGHLYLRGQAEFHCGNLVVDVSVNLRSNVPFWRDPESGVPTHDIPAAEAAVASRGPEVSRKTADLAARLAAELRRRRLC